MSQGPPQSRLFVLFIFYVLLGTCGGAILTATISELLNDTEILERGGVVRLRGTSDASEQQEPPPAATLPEGVSVATLRGINSNVPVGLYWSQSPIEAWQSIFTFTLIDWSHMNSIRPALALKPGQELTLASLLLYLVDMDNPISGSTTLDTLAPSGLIRIPAGAKLRLENVTFILSDSVLREVLAAMCGGLGPWPYNPGLLIEGGTMRIASHTSWAENEDDPPGAGGQVQWSNVTILASPGEDSPLIPNPYPCAALAITHGSQLGVEAAALLNATAGPVYLYITTDIALPADGSWQTVEVPNRGLLVLLGDPVRNITLDLAGVEGAWRAENAGVGSAPFGVAQLQDLTLVNLPHAAEPFKEFSWLSVAILSFSVEQAILLLGSHVEPQIICTRCTLVLPDPEVAFLSSAVGRGQLAFYPSVINIFSIMLTEPEVLETNSMLRFGGLDMGLRVRLANCMLISASCYQRQLMLGGAPLLPEAWLWPLLIAHRNEELAIRLGPFGLCTVRGLFEAPEVLPPDENVTALIASRLDVSTPAIADDPYMLRTKIMANTDPWASPDSLVVAGYPQELGKHRVFVDLRGRLQTMLLTQPLTLRDLVLYNLAPGGVYPLMGSTGSDEALTPTPPDLSSDDAPWGNSTLPLWFFGCARSPKALMRLRTDALASGQGPGQSAQHAAQADDVPELGPRLVLDNVTLVVPETEWRSLVAAVLLYHAPEAMAAAQQRRQQQTGRRAQLQERRQSEHQTQAGGSVPQWPRVKRGVALPGWMWRRLREGTGWAKDRKLLPFVSSMEPPEDNPWPGSVLPVWFIPLVPPPVYGDPGVPSSPGYPPSLPPSPPSPRPPPLPPSDTIRTALEKFAAASKVLSYDFKSGQLVLAVARHYGWVGTNVTIKHRLPSDAPSNATLLPYASLSLPYEDLARMDIDVQVGDLALPPKGLQRNPTPAAGSRDHHDPKNGDGLPDWLLPVTCTLASVGVVSLLIALVAISVARQWRSQLCQRLPSVMRSPGSTTEMKLPQVEPDFMTVATTLSCRPCKGAEDPQAATQRSNEALPEDANKPVMQAYSLLPTAIGSDAAGSCTVQTDMTPDMQSRTTGSAPQAALPRHALPYNNYLAVVHDYYRQAVAGAVEDPMAQQQASCPEPRASVGDAASLTLRRANASRDMAATIRALQFKLRDPDLAVEAVLDCGASAVVYRGVWRGLPVAVKTLVVAGAAAGGSRQRAVLEAAISMSLTHVNVVATYAYDIKSLVLGPSGGVLGSSAQQAEGQAEVTDSGCTSTEQYEGDDASAFKVYIIQELCNGGSLRNALEHGVAGCILGGGVRRLLALHLALDVAAGMRHIHASRIVHGDLKPANVLLVFDTRRRSMTSFKCDDLDTRVPGNDGVFSLIAKVADFGLSVPLSEDTTHASQHFQGTLTYVAPEVFSAGQLSPRSDVWSFGIVLVELFYGRSLLEPNSLAGLGIGADDAPSDANQSVVNSTGPSVPALVEDMAQQSSAAVRPFTQLVSECLDPEPRRRPDFTEIVVRLQQLLTAEGHAASGTEAALSEAANAPARAAVEVGVSSGQTQSTLHV